MIRTKKCKLLNNVMLNIKKFSCLLLFLGTFVCVRAFEGDIKAVRQSQYDTSYLIFYVKDNKARIDEFNETGQITKTLLVNLETSEITALSPTLRVYTHVMSKRETDAHPRSNFDIIKTTNFKLIDGKKCFQWRVRNRLLDSEITYWVMESEVSVMSKLFSVLNDTEAYSSIPSFFLQIPDKEGFLPVLAVERNLVREEKQSMEITSVNQRSVSDKLFEIPKDYKNLRL